MILAFSEGGGEWRFAVSAYTQIWVRAVLQKNLRARQEHCLCCSVKRCEASPIWCIPLSAESKQQSQSVKVTVGQCYVEQVMLRLAIGRSSGFQNLLDDSVVSGTDSTDESSLLRVRHSTWEIPRATVWQSAVI